MTLLIPAGTLSCHTTDTCFYTCRNDIISTNTCLFMHVGMTSFCSHVVYKFIEFVVVCFTFMGTILCLEILSAGKRIVPNSALDAKNPFL